MSKELHEVSSDLLHPDMNFHFDENRHQYVVSGEGENIILPGVTSVIDMLPKPWLMWWALNCARDWIIEEGFKKHIDPDNPMDEVQVRKLAKEARVAHRKDTGMDIGTIVHEWVEEYVNNRIEGKSDDPELPDNEASQEAIIEFLQWEQDHYVGYLESELRVWNPEIGYAGTIDCIAEVDGVIEVIDWKTSKDLYPGNKMQVSSYYMARCGMDYTPSGVRLARFPKKPGQGGFETWGSHDEAEINQHYDGFKGAHQLYLWDRRNDN